MRVLVVNAGSSSLKLRLLADDDRVLASYDITAHGGRFDYHDIEAVLTKFGEQIDVVGHRVVHGGQEFTGPVLLDGDVRDRLAALTDLAPLHQPKSLAAMDAVCDLLPNVRAVACFDTAFHARMPMAAATYAVPEEWRARYAVRRYGFHGLSHAYAARRAAELIGASRVVTCHLGAGASLAAVRDGVSIDTTMGFTPLEGLVMATRSGSVDPGLLLWLQNHEGLSADEVAEALEHHSGLLALAGSPDMREIVRRAESGDAQATLALDVYLRALCAGVAAMSVALSDIDAIVFTGGVGEHAGSIREAAAMRLRCLGIEIEPSLNAAAAVRSDDPSADVDISAPGAKVRTLVVAAREDLEIAHEVRAVLPVPPVATSPAATSPAAIPPRS
jgi:acetate kinase